VRTRVHPRGPFCSLALERLARWWTEASNEARFGLYAKALHGEEEAPPLDALRVAIYLAETEAGEVQQG
jgi:hypothetical protein